MAGQPPGLRLSYVVLFCADFPTSLRFYHNLLGLTAEQQTVGFALLSAGPVRLGLHAARPGQITHGVNLHFEVADLEAAVKTLTARGIAFRGAPRQEPWGARVARTADPDDNVVEIIQWLPTASP
jgi:catechol 2,3-dioxygenase-like lactoylglutathione lyase family enzyme